MLKPGSFYFLFLIFYCPIALAGLLLVYFFKNEQAFNAFASGVALSIIIVLLAVFIADRIIDKSLQLFLSGVIGGMIFRFIAVFAISFYVLKRTDFNMVSFFLGFLGSFLILQTLDIIYLNSKFSKAKEKRNEGS